MQATTLQVRSAINEAFRSLKVRHEGTWTDPEKFDKNKTKDRVVAYRTYAADRVAAVANDKLIAAGFSNRVRVTDTETGFRGGNGPYIRVNAVLA